jgi:hypothetical protein
LSQRTLEHAVLDYFGGGFDSPGEGLLPAAFTAMRR